jgi:hypothetical protein
MSTVSNSILLLQSREFISSHKPIYKLCKTKQPLLARFNQYPVGSRLLIQIKCVNCDYCKDGLLEIFKAKYINKLDYGNDYFEGDSIDMVSDIVTFIQNEKNN